MPKGVYPRKHRPESAIEPRFWSKVQKSEDCWLWTGASAKRAHATYGHIWYGGKVDRAHRVSWKLHFGPISEGMQVLHRCDTPLCVRPDHLFLGSQLDNIHDMERKGRRRSVSGDAHHARRPGARVGERNGRARITAADVPVIRQLRADGLMFREIAARYGVAVPTIMHIVSRKNWSHIP